MSELITVRNTDMRKTLLATASAIALASYIAATNPASADDVERPTVWIELGGQMEFLDGMSSSFTAPFMTAITPTPGPYSDNIFLEGQKPPRFAFGLEGKITVQPADSGWIFSAGVRYGRSRADRHIHKQSAPPTITFFGGNSFTKYGAAFADTKSQYSEQHAILDFQVGKDVGLGVFGHDGASNINLGVRFADFSSRSNVDIHGRPTVELVNTGFFSRTAFHGYTLTAHAERSFRGVGPSLSWNASAAIVGNKQDGELTLDWGIQGALLFGRQKAKTDHQSASYYKPPRYSYLSYYGTKQLHPPHHDARSKSVVVPNLGGLIGVSVRYPNAKVTLGYRADFFFGAMDTGIDARGTSDIGFQGPFATISIGLGG